MLEHNKPPPEKCSKEITITDALLHQGLTLCVEHPLEKQTANFLIYELTNF